MFSFFQFAGSQFSDIFSSFLSSAGVRVSISLPSTFTCAHLFVTCRENTRYLYRVASPALSHWIQYYQHLVFLSPVHFFPSFLFLRLPIFPPPPLLDLSLEHSLLSSSFLSILTPFLLSFFFPFLPRLPSFSFCLTIFPPLLLSSLFTFLHISLR